MIYSYHIFYFPFKWEIMGLENQAFSDQVNLDNIQYNRNSHWERSQKPDPGEEESLYNEKNYYYTFVHNILYDEEHSPLNLIHHFERKEPKLSNHIYYYIKKKGRNNPYKLIVDAMNINLYATGVGFLSFYLKNEDCTQNSPEDILAINQYGRRIMPPFFNDTRLRNEISEYIRIEGLNQTVYFEDFKSYTPYDSWQPSSSIKKLICELVTNLSIDPIIDDRMFVATWYKNNQLSQQFTNNAKAYFDSQDPFSDYWYRLLFIDGSNATFQNEKMKKELLEEHTYYRWQQWSSLYGISKYSLVYLTNNEVPDYLIEYFQTIYARMAELVLVQRASMLRFSGEITKVSQLSNQDVEAVSKRVSSLYKEYIRFVNQIYFREITAQDQGIEMYNKLHSCLQMESYIKDLDGEIEELHQYISLMEDRERNKKASLLNDIATLFLPITVITGFWGMNQISEVMEENGELSTSFIIQSLLLIIGTLCAICIIYKRKRKL